MPSIIQVNGRGGLWNETLGQVCDLLARMERAGFDRDLLARMRAEPSFLTRLAECAEQGAIPETLTQHHARVYFTHYFSPADWWRFVEEPLTDEQLRLVECFPWPPEIADQPDPFAPEQLIRETHFAFPMWSTFGPKDREVPLNLGWWLERVRDLIWFAGDTTEPWFSGRYFAEETSFGSRWYLVRLEPPKESLNLSFAEQRERIPKNYEMVPPIVMVTAHLLYFLQHRKWYFGGPQTLWGRCGDWDDNLDGNGIIVGTALGGVQIREVNPERVPMLGLHLMRRLPQSGGRS